MERNRSLLLAVLAAAGSATARAQEATPPLLTPEQLQEAMKCGNLGRGLGQFGAAILSRVNVVPRAAAD